LPVWERDIPQTHALDWGKRVERENAAILSVRLIIDHVLCSLLAAVEGGSFTDCQLSASWECGVDRGIECGYLKDTFTRKAFHGEPINAFTIPFFALFPIATETLTRHL
jgi:hypothetical protein